MSDIWLISDTHFCHKNILKFVDKNGEFFRGNRFSSVEEMNDCMYDNWNETVKPNDEVFHLGDLIMGKDENFVKRFKSLNGKKKLIVGNHDNIKWIVREDLFKDVVMLHLMREHGLLLTHVPIDKSGLHKYNANEENSLYINVHGHIHQNLSPSENHRCVCVEWTDYKPIAIEEVASLNNYVS